MERREHAAIVCQSMPVILVSSQLTASYGVQLIGDATVLRSGGATGPD